MPSIQVAKEGNDSKADVDRVGAPTDKQVASEVEGGGGTEKLLLMGHAKNGPVTFLMVSHSATH